MGIKTVVCYVATCDDCGEEELGDDYIQHHATEAEARQWVRDCNGNTFGDHLSCERCTPPCTCGHRLWDHDHGDAPCDECPCEGYNPALADAVEVGGEDHAIRP